MNYTDQYGNPVHIQAHVQMEATTQNTYPVGENLVNTDPVVVQQILWMNPVIQQLVEERVALYTL